MLCNQLPMKMADFLDQSITNESAAVHPMKSKAASREKKFFDGSVYLEESKSSFVNKLGSDLRIYKISLWS